MAEPSNKPRDIKNLKARLGRTITPGQVGSTPGQLGSVPPMGSAPMSSPGGSLPPPSIRASVPPPTLGNPLGGPAPMSAPPLGGIPRSSVPTPAFAVPRPAPAGPAAFPQQQPAQPAPQARAAAASPFDMTAPAVAVTEKKVRLVIDDSAIKDEEVGRKTSTKVIATAAILGALGLVVGFMVGGTAGERKQYTMAVADAKDIYARIGEVGKTIEAAKGNMKKAVEASQSGSGKPAAVDYKAIESLVALKHPFSADEFARRRYLAFPTATVDALFEYYNNINLLFKKLESLGSQTTGERKREALDKAAKAADELMTSEYGIVLSKQGDALAGGIVIARAKPADEAGEEKKGKDDKPEAPMLLVSSREGGREVERTLYMGQEDIGEKYDQYVIMVDKGRSMAALGGAANLYGEFRGELMEANALLEKTLELQGRLIKELGPVAALD